MEPERPIEKLLRESAKKRREDAGAPLDMHPATRRMLQGEVSRIKGAKSLNKSNELNRLNEEEPGSFVRGLARLWPSLRWSLTMFAGLVIAATLMVPRERKSENPTLLALQKE